MKKELHCKKLREERNKDVFGKIEAVLKRVFGQNYEISDCSEESLKQYMRLMNLTAGINDTNFHQYCPGIPITLKYDKIVITNSRKQVYTMLDTYVSISVNIEGQLLHTPRVGNFGVMSTTAGSWFSHVHGGGIGQYAATCTGSGPINKIMQKLSHNQFDDKVFESFLVALKAHLEWENLEGGYHMLAEVNEKKKETLDPNPKIPKGFFEFLFSEAKKLDLKSLLRFSIGRQNKLTTESTEALEMALGSIIADKSRWPAELKKEVGESSKLLCLKAASGVYFSNVATVSGKDKKIATTPLFKFNGKDVFNKTLNVKEYEKIEKRYFANPVITEKIRRKVHEGIVKGSTTKCKTTKLQGTTRSKAKTAKSNTTSV